MDFFANLLQSRAFWSGLGPVIVAIFNLAGRPLGDDSVQALTVIITFLGGFFGVTAMRAARGKPTSYKKLSVKAEKAEDDAKYGGLYR